MVTFMNSTTITDSPDYDHLVEVTGDTVSVKCPTCGVYLDFAVADRFGSHDCDCGEGRIVWE